MLYRGVVNLCFITAILVFTVGFAQSSTDVEKDYEEYTAVHGDSLIIIAKKELNDAFLWPRIWQENPEIIDPNLIFKGQIIRIPRYLKQGNEIDTDKVKQSN
ncbi:MAG: hypothetical protein C0402_13445 [Thermodesulfovibrio sp.]|nr:hypothetical protein [Thermodesulfovibrio sp.]